MDSSETNQMKNRYQSWVSFRMKVALRKVASFPSSKISLFLSPWSCWYTVKGDPATSGLALDLAPPIVLLKGLEYYWVNKGISRVVASHVLEM